MNMLLTDITSTGPVVDPKVTQTFTEKISEFFHSINIDKYQDVMNPTVWSTQSIEGIIVLILILFVIYKLFHKAYKFAWWCIGLIFFIEVCYLLSFTTVNNYIPLSEIFQFSILQSLAQLCVGTKLSSALLWIDELLTQGIFIAGNAFVEFCKALWRIFQNAMPQLL